MLWVSVLGDGEGQRGDANIGQPRKSTSCVPFVFPTTTPRQTGTGGAGGNTTGGGTWGSTGGPRPFKPSTGGGVATRVARRARARWAMVAQAPLARISMDATALMAVLEVVRVDVKDSRTSPDSFIHYE